MMPQCAYRRRRQGGFALIAVLWVVVVASLILVGVQKGSQVELAAAYGELSGVQAQWMARAGVERAISQLHAESALGGCDSMRNEWFDNKEAFNIDLSLGVCCVLAPLPAGPAAPTATAPARRYRFGPTDLASLVNVNTADENQLFRLGGLTGAQINAILDWRDPNDNGRPGGAKQDYYDSLPYSYLMRNGSLKTVGELRLVKGIDFQTFYGQDANGDVLPDRYWTTLAGLQPATTNDTRQTMGIGDRLTVHSFEPNLDAAGQKRVNVNSVDADTLKQRYNFSDALAQGFVSHTTSHAPSSPGAGPGGPGASSAAGRSSTDTRSSPGGGPSSGGGAGGTPGGPEGAKPSGGRFGSLFELLDVQPAQQGQAQANSSSGQSGKVDRIDIDWLAQHWDELTLTDDQRLPGRINVNTAAPDILMTLPDMAEAEMDAICQRRDGPKGPFLSVGELYISKTLSQDRFKSVAERVCVRSGAFEVRSIATTRLGVRRQIVAIVDRTAKPASILYWYQGE